MKRGSRLLALLLSLSPLLARADGPTPSPAPSPPSASLATSLVSLAEDLAAQLGPAARGAKVSTEPLRADQRVPRADELVGSLASLVSGRLDRDSLKSKRAETKVVMLKPELAKGDLRVTASLLVVAQNRWDRLKNRDASEVAHAFAIRPVDAEIRSFLTPILLEQASIHRATHEENEALAIACGDLDGDGGNELLIVSRTRVVLGRLRAGRFITERGRTWADIGKRIPVPLSEPIGAAALARKSVFVGTTDYGGYRLDAALANATATSGLPLLSMSGAPYCAVHAPEAFGFDGLLRACEGKESLLLPSTRFDAAAALRLRTKSGKDEEVVAAREGTGRLRLRSSLREGSQALENAGAQVLLADLDLDGVPELVTSSDGRDDDNAHVYSWRGDGLALRRKIPAPTGIRGFAACPPEDGAAPALAMLVGSEVWLVR